MAEEYSRVDAIRTPTNTVCIGIFGKIKNHPLIDHILSIDGTRFGGGEGIRTLDFHVANVTLSH